MRYLRFTLLPLLLVACEREPIAPRLDDRPDFSGNSDWQEFTVTSTGRSITRAYKKTCTRPARALFACHTVIVAGETRHTFHVELVDGTWQLEDLTTGHIWLPRPGNHTVSRIRPEGMSSTGRSGFIT